jgi:hypothetical protein
MSANMELRGTRAAWCCVASLIVIGCGGDYVVGQNLRNVPPGQADAATACKLIFDVAHGEARFSNPDSYTSVGGWAHTRDLLVQGGYSWNVNADPIAEMAAGAAWIFSEPTENFAPDEIDAIERFVRRGGALMLTTDFDIEFMNPIAQRFGATFTGESTGWVRITDFTPGHPITGGLTSVSWPDGSLLALQDDRIDVLARYQGRPAIAAERFGAGRVVFVSENEAFSRAGIEGFNDPTGPEPRSNERLLFNIAAWLTGCAPPK